MKRGPVHIVPQPPASMRRTADGRIQLDFGKVAFGNLRVHWPPGFGGIAVFHFGEALANGGVDRTPPGAFRYARVETAAAQGNVVAPPPNAKNTGPAAVTTPAVLGTLLPFRWVEVEGWPEATPVYLAQIRRQAAFARDWSDDASAFACSNPLLNEIWELSRYSIKATTFAGIYVDGDRERIAYEADASLNQISHQACDPDPALARATFDHLLERPTWPTEWSLHMPFMAHADWMYTKDRSWLASRYDALYCTRISGHKVGVKRLV
jgi:alpha-L-rhamnosidase